MTSKYIKAIQLHLCFFKSTILLTKKNIAMFDYDIYLKW